MTKVDKINSENKEKNAKNCLKNIKKWFPPGIEPGTYHLQLQRSTNSATQLEKNFLKSWLYKIRGKAFISLFPLPAAREWENFFILALS